MKKIVLILSAVVVAMSASATNWDVEVGGGGNNGTPYYEPQNLVINQGDVVTWTWATGQHNVTSTSGPVDFASGTKFAPDTWSFTFDVAGTYTYECTVGTHSNTQFGEIVVNAGNSVSNLEPVANFVTYPNPASDVLSVSRENAMPASVRLIDLTGRTVAEIPATTEQVIRIPVNEFPAGIYFTEVAVNGQVVRKRVTIR